MDDRTRTCPDLETFIAEVAARGLATVVLAWQREYAQDVLAQGVVYDRLARTTCLAYDKVRGTLVTCTQDGSAADREALARRLAAAGLRVEERCRNLG